MGFFQQLPKRGVIFDQPVDQVVLVIVHLYRDAAVIGKLDNERLAFVATAAQKFFGL